ncbi:NAD(P)-binding protein [Cucurbitaria berberidis CBS 394.84]|uniref:NAD(P)-binding protein n=1 Tax=Cucurbitaria berberidis CBS 394.84 TaxID=1168544 RepID=A0A9P4L8G7_9PLEO|nr:NAD(P)-binding protein [Cucurbitaria berberidis CBS 394.84]KAF1846020.1 NAD(P)-binding protein [Cucurbitaria berberidis CBS 394.84]
MGDSTIPIVIQKPSRYYAQAYLQEALGGGLGFLGSHITSRLLADNHATTIISTSRNPKPDASPKDTRLVHHALDITSPGSVDTLFKTLKPTVVVHSASPPPRSHASLLEYFECPNPYARTKALADALVLAANSPSLRTVTLRIFEFVYVESAVKAHVLAAHALLTHGAGADGQAYFVTDRVPRPFFDFMRLCYVAANCTVSREEVRVIPLWAVQTMASVGEWAFWIFTLRNVTPQMRDDINHLDTGCFWSIEKGRRVLGYEPVLGQDEAIRMSVEWGMGSL